MLKILKQRPDLEQNVSVQLNCVSEQRHSTNFPIIKFQSPYYSDFLYMF